MKKLKALFLLGIIALVSCEEVTDPLNCSPTIVCTEQFESFSFDLTDSDNQPILLDNFYSQNLDNGNIYDFSDASDQLSGNTYIIITDAQRNELKQEGTTIRFFGEKDGQIIVQEDFLIGHDCCHIVPLEGIGVGN